MTLVNEFEGIEYEVKLQLGLCGDGQAKKVAYSLFEPHIQDCAFAYDDAVEERVSQNHFFTKSDESLVVVENSKGLFVKTKKYIGRRGDIPLFVVGRHEDVVKTSLQGICSLLGDPGLQMCYDGSLEKTVYNRSVLDTKDDRSYMVSLSECVRSEGDVLHQLEMEYIGCREGSSRVTFGDKQEMFSGLGRLMMCVMDQCQYHGIEAVMTNQTKHDFVKGQ